MHVVANFSLTFSESKEHFTVYLQTLTFNHHLYLEHPTELYPKLELLDSTSRISPNQLKLFGLDHPYLDMYESLYELKYQLEDTQNFLEEAGLLKKFKKKERYRV